MPLGFGLAASHAPALFARTPDGWERAWRRFRGDAPDPPEIAAEDAAQIGVWIARTAAAFGVLRERLSAYEPDVVLVIAGDQDEWFDAAHLPNLMVYCGGDAIEGYHNHGADDSEPRLLPWEHPDLFGVTVPVASDVGERVLAGLVAREFDVAISRRLPAYEGRRKAPHGLVRPLPLLLPHAGVPIVPIIIKTVERTPAALTGERCLELGRAIAEICAELPQKVAVFGSGGMSHDPRGPRACWVDEPLDRWFLNRIAAGRPGDLASLFSFRSAATESGTGELRTWLPVAAAMDALQPGVCATVVDYFAARKSTAGCGWAYWDAAAARQ